MNSDETIFKAVYRLCEADGVVSDEEQDWFDTLMEEYQIDNQRVDSVLSLEELRDSLPGEESKMYFMRLLLMISLADGNTCGDEWAYIQEVGQQIGYGADKLELLRSQLS